MDFLPAPTQSNSLTTLRLFLLAILPAGTEVIQGQINRVPEPRVADYVVMTPVLRKRLSSNIDTYADVAFTAAINGTVMTVSAVAFGVIEVDQRVSAVGVTAGTIITALGSGTGGVGTYVVDPAQTVGSEVMASGGQYLMQPTQLTIQLDVHGPASAENSQLISTLFRDEYGVRLFAELGDGATPLYTADPIQMPFVNGEQAYEDRWVISAMMQANELIRVPQQFADELDVTLINVDQQYPIQ